MNNEFGEVLTDSMKIAVVLNIMPRSIQEHVYGHIGTEDTYENTVYKMKVMAGQKTAMDIGGPVPMDIGRMEKDNFGREGAGEEDHRCVAVWR